ALSGPKITCAGPTTGSPMQRPRVRAREITIGDDAGECGNRRIGTACSAHLRNSRGNRMQMVPPIGDDNRLVAAIGYMPGSKSQWDASGTADKDDRLGLSDLCARLADCQ